MKSNCRSLEKHQSIVKQKQTSTIGHSDLSIRSSFTNLVFLNNRKIEYHAVIKFFAKNDKT